MDKRKLYKDIAQIKKQIFAFTCLIAFVSVALATFIGHGFDFYMVFRNSVIALIVFGVLSYMWGYLYAIIVEKPLIESYRMDAQRRIEELKNAGNQRLSMKISVSELSPGMKVIDAIYSNEGALLVREGAVLTERLIRTLKDHNIPSVKVEAQRNAPEEEVEE